MGIGRQEITHNPRRRVKFRALDHAQLQGRANLFQTGSVNKVRDAVEYFNAGCSPGPHLPEQAPTL